MGMDRKNKRAQQQAQRDAEAAQHNSPEHLASMPPPTDEAPPSPVKQSSGIARALEKNEGSGRSTMSGFVPSPTLPSSAAVTIEGSSDSSKTSRSSSNPWGIPLPNSVRGIANQESLAKPSRQLGFSTDQPAASSPPTSNMTSIRSSLSSIPAPLPAAPKMEPYNPLPIGTPPKTSSFTSGSPFASGSPFGLRAESEAFAPSRPLAQGMNRTVSSPAFDAFGPSHTDTSSSVFGTSPFSAPGSKSIFLSSLPQEDAKYGKSVNAVGGDAPSAITRMMMARNGLVFEEEDSDDEEDADDFLPSSLHDLLSPEELERRRRRAEKAAVSSSVPNPPQYRRASIVDERDEIVYSPTRSNGFSISPKAASYIEPTRSLFTQPPGSLPAGLAAGMSRLHLRPAPPEPATPPTYSHSPRGIERPSALGRRVSSGGANKEGFHVGSPLSQTWTSPHQERERQQREMREVGQPGSPKAGLMREEELPFEMD